LVNNVINVEGLDLKPGDHIHFIGIGGSSMNGIAEILLKRGYSISGSDRVESAGTMKLRELGIEVHIGHDAKNIPDNCTFVVYTLAISSDNPELLKAKERHIQIMERGTFLGLLTKEHPFSIAVAGTHGKTTTTSMIAAILIASKLDPSVHLGGYLPLINGSARASSGPYFITEACEYHRNFLNLFPFGGVILNIEAEHLDYYKDLNDVKEAFTDFAKLMPTEGFLVYCSDEANTADVVKSSKCIKASYGFNKIINRFDNVHYSAKNIINDKKGGYIFEILKNNVPFCEVHIHVPGMHNVLNALAATATADLLKCSHVGIIEGLDEFYGTSRRFEKKGFCNNALVIDDYAHHPTEIEATLKAASTMCLGNLWCIFQPHTYSRSKACFNMFPAAFAKSHMVILSDIYASREKDPGDINSQMISDYINENGTDSTYISSFDEIASYVRSHVKPEDMILILGAGDITTIADMLTDK